MDKPEAKHREKHVEPTEQPKAQAPIETMVDADDMEMTEAFRVLCLPPHATAYEVKRAYRKAALAVHPDKPGGSARLFRRVQAAYEVCLAAVEAFGAAADVAVDHDEPWAKAARAFPGFAALGGLVVRGTEDEPYDWLYFDGEEEEPWDAVLDRVAAARDHFGRPPPTGESPWLEVSGLARLLDVEAGHGARARRGRLPRRRRRPDGHATRVAVAAVHGARRRGEDGVERPERVVDAAPAAAVRLVGEEVHGGLVRQEVRGPGAARARLLEHGDAVPLLLPFDAGQRGDGRDDDDAHGH